MGQLGVFKNWEVHDTFRKLGVEFNSPLFNNEILWFGSRELGHGWLLFGSQEIENKDS